LGPATGRCGDLGLAGFDLGLATRHPNLELRQLLALRGPEQRV